MVERGAAVLFSLFRNQVAAQSESGGPFGLDEGEVYFVLAESVVGGVLGRQGLAALVHDVDLLDVDGLVSYVLRRKHGRRAKLGGLDGRVLVLEGRQQHFCFEHKGVLIAHTDPGPVHLEHDLKDPHPALRLLRAQRHQLENAARHRDCKRAPDLVQLVVQHPDVLDGPSENRLGRL